MPIPVSWAVHGFECKDVLFHGEGEHVLAVVLPVARRLPQLAVVDVGGGHLLEATSAVLLLYSPGAAHQEPIKFLCWCLKFFFKCTVRN